MLPCRCPACHSPLKVRSLGCPACGTEVTGTFGMPLLASLDEADRDFVLRFVRCSGSLKRMAAEMNLSYPTVRNMLDGVIEKLNGHE